MCSKHGKVRSKVIDEPSSRRRISNPLFQNSRLAEMNSSAVTSRQLAAIRSPGCQISLQAAPGAHIVKHDPNVYALSHTRFVFKVFHDGVPLMGPLILFYRFGYRCGLPGKQTPYVIITLYPSGNKSIIELGRLTVHGKVNTDPATYKKR